MTPRRIQLSLVSLVAVATLVIGVLTSTQTTAQITYGDNAWYLNRGRIILDGGQDSSFTYNSLYPVIVALVDRITQDSVLAGMWVNTGSTVLLVYLTYRLGSVLYSARVGLVAGLIVLFTPKTLELLTYYNGSTLFVALSVWVVVECVIAVRKPSLWRGLWIGVLLVLALYTRFEGAIYAGLVVLTFGGAAAWVRSDRVRRNAYLRIAVLVTVIFAAGFAYYWRVFATDLAASGSGGGSSNALIATIEAAGSRSDLLSMRLMDTFGNWVTAYPAWAWIVVPAALLIPNSQRVSRWKWGLLIGLVLLNPVYIFLLSAYPLAYYFIHFVPFFAVLFAESVRLITSNLLTVLILTALILVPGLSHSARQVAELQFTDSSLDVQAIDQWIVANGYADRYVFSLCPYYTPYLRSRVWLIYRLAGSYNSDTNWNSPEPLRERMRRTGELLLICKQSPVYFADWKPILETESGEITYFRKVSELGSATLYAAPDAPSVTDKPILERR